MRLTGLPRASVSESVPEPDIVRACGEAREGRDPPEEFLDRLSVKRFGLNLFFERPRGSLGLIGETVGDAGVLTPTIAEFSPRFTDAFVPLQIGVPIILTGVSSPRSTDADVIRLVNSGVSLDGSTSTEL